MTLETLSLVNFKRYATLELTFESGLYGILGRNGSGKSTLFEAIGFALYGHYRGSKELIRTASQSGNVSVTLTFTLRQKTCRVVREFRGKNLTAFATLYEQDEAVASGVKEVNAVVTSMLGMGKEPFLHTVFATQKELTALSSMKNEDRKAMMRRLLGLEKLDAIEAMLREASRDLNRDLKTEAAYLLSDTDRKELLLQRTDKSTLQQHSNEQLAAMKAEDERLKTAFSTAKAEVESHQKARERRQTALAEHERTLQRLQQHEKELTSLDRELADLHNEAKRRDTLLPLKSALQTLEKTLKEYETLRLDFVKREALEKEQETLRKTYLEWKTEITRLSGAIAPLPELRTELETLRRNVESGQKALDSIDEALKILHGRIAADRAKITELETRVQRITSLGSDSPCPVCTRPLLEQYDDVVTALHDEIRRLHTQQIDAARQEQATGEAKRKEAVQGLRKVEEQAATTDKRITLLQSQHNDLEKAQTRLKEIEARGKGNKAALEALGEVHYDAQQHDTAQQEHRTLKPQVETLLGLDALIGTIPAKTEARQTLAAQIDQDTAALKTKQDALDAATYSETAHKEAKEEAARREQAAEQHRQAIHTLSLRLAGITHEVAAIDKEIAADDARRADYAQKIVKRNDYEKLKVVMAAFKTHVNARVAPRISDIAGEMYARITRGRYQHIEVTPEFDFFIFDQGTKYPIERFSGGEIDLANLVLRIAVSRTLGELSGGDTLGFLAFDEIFGSQDEERRFRIIEALHTISESYRQIFLISHETEIREFFEHAIEC